MIGENYVIQSVVWEDVIEDFPDGWAFKVESDFRVDTLIVDFLESRRRL